MKYRRLKTLDSTGVPILRYYKLTDPVAYCNAFYKIVAGEATKIEGEVSGAALIGFSHGGNNLAKGLIFLDINETPLYMAILDEEEDARPEIGDLVNGYQRVVDTHYEEESAEGKNTDKFGVEYLDVPYYIFKIEQPEATNTDTVDDSAAGEVSGVNTENGENPQPTPTTVNKALIYIATEGGTGILKYTEKGGTEQTATLTYGGEPFETLQVANVDDKLSTVYDAIAMYDDTGTNLVCDLSDIKVAATTTVQVAVPTV